MPIIYVDVLFAVNFIINYILLRTCCAFVSLKKKKIRIASGAFIGACYSVLIFFPNFSLLYSMIFKLLISMLLLAISYPFYSIRSYIKTLLVFYMISFGFGGCVLCVFYFCEIGARLGAVYSNGVFYFNLPWGVLLFSAISFYITAKIFGHLSQRVYSLKKLKKKIYLTHNDNTAEVTALLDTGNTLTDPVTGTPVIIAEYKSIKNLFSADLCNILENAKENDIALITDSIGEKRFPVRLIPFNSIGKENGMLIGFVPDKVELRDECGIRTLGKCVVGICKKPLTNDRSYTALLNPYLH